VYLSIGLGGAPPASFTIGAIGAKRSANGRPLVVANIYNHGKRTLEISGSLTFSRGPAGLSAGPFPVTLGPALAPRASRAMTVRLDKRLPRGPWRVRLRLTSGLIQKSAVATIEFPAVPAPPSGA
jgi:hypothetical protein